MNKLIAIIILTLFASLSIMAQNTVADSLYNIIKTANEPIIVVDAYEALTKSYFKTNQDSSIAIAQRGIDYAKKNKLKSKIALLTKSLGTAYFYKQDPTNAIKYYSQAGDLFKKENDLNEYVAAYQNVALAYRISGNYKKAFESLDMVVAECIEEGDKKLEAVCYNTIGIQTEEIGLQNH